MQENTINKIKYKIRKIIRIPTCRNTKDLKKSNKTTKTKNFSLKMVIYQTWIDNKFGKTHAKIIFKSFRELNKNLSFRIYSNQMMEDYMEKNWGQTKNLPNF